MAIKINTSRMAHNYTGEGFKGEKLLSFMAVGLTIISTILLIHVTLLQKQQIHLELEALNKKKEEDKTKETTKS